MSNRVIKESIKRSPQIDSLTWFEEVVFYRLIVTADDYGCVDGRTVLLKNDLFPTKDSITKKAIEDAISKLVSVGLLQKYEVSGMPYLRFITWEKHQRVRNKWRKYPEPPDLGDEKFDKHLSANRCQTPANCPDESESESESNPNPESKSVARARNSAPLPPVDGFGPALTAAIEEWLAYKRERREDYKPTGFKNMLAQIRKNADMYGETAVADLIRYCMAANWKGIIFDRLAQPGQSKSRSGQTGPEYREMIYGVDTL